MADVNTRGSETEGMRCPTCGSDDRAKRPEMVLRGHSSAGLGPCPDAFHAEFNKAERWPDGSSEPKQIEEILADQERYDAEWLEIYVLPVSPSEGLTREELERKLAHRDEQFHKLLEVSAEQRDEHKAALKAADDLLARLLSPYAQIENPTLRRNIERVRKLLRALLADEQVER